MGEGDVEPPPTSFRGSVDRGPRVAPKQFVIF